MIPVARPVAKPYIPSTFRERLTELAGGFAPTPLVAAACTIPFALFQDAALWTLLGRVFLLDRVDVGTPAGRPAAAPRRQEPVGPPSGSPRGRAWGGRSGVLARWVVDADGYRERDDARHRVRDGHRVGPDTFTAGIKYLFYFGLATAACRWWVATDRKRKATGCG